MLLLISVTLIQPVQSKDVVLAHLGAGAEVNICIGDGLHSGLVVPREGIPGIIKNTEVTF